MSLDQICAYSKQPICSQCKGAVYECDPIKNTPCKKTFCGECIYTSQIEYAKNSQPLCPRKLIAEEIEKDKKRSGVKGEL